PWIHPILDFGVVVEFETHLFSGLACDDVGLIHDVERDITFRPLGHMKFSLNLSDKEANTDNGQGKTGRREELHMDLLPDAEESQKMIRAYPLVESVGHDSRLVATVSLSTISLSTVSLS